MYTRSTPAFPTQPDSAEKGISRFDYLVIQIAAGLAANPALIDLIDHDRIGEKAVSIANDIMCEDGGIIQ